MPSRLQSALDPAGAQAAHIEQLWWITFAISTVVFVAVVGVLVLAILRSRRAETPHANQSRLARTVAAATVLTTLTLIALVWTSAVKGRTLQRADDEQALRVLIVGYQWWWSIEYLDAQPSQRVRTANELYLPAGRPIEIALTSVDVIHSFWVPTLNGKTDMIPGRWNYNRLRADRPGRYRGQCAEFCGVQHAHMALDVVVVPEAEFLSWLHAQRQPASAPADLHAQRGRDVFERSTCAMCHSVLGTPAGARTAPDLTHVASRSRIAAGVLPNDPAELDRWIADPQAIKPGTRMPPTGLSDEDRRAVVAYLRTLR